MVEKTLNRKLNEQRFENNTKGDALLVKEKKLKEKEKIPLQQSKFQQKNIVKNNPKIVEEIREKPVIGEIHEKRQIQKKRKDIIKEKYEQPVIQVEEQPIIKNVERKPLYKKFVDTARVEEYGNKNATLEKTRNLEKSADNVGVKLTKEKASVNRIEEKPVVSEISKRDNIKIVNQPVIHEIHEQQIIEEHEQPIIKRYYNKPIVKKVVNRPVYVAEGYEEAGRQRREDLKPLNRKVVDQAEQTLESNINQDYKGYDKLPYDYEERQFEDEKNKRSYADVAKLGPEIRQRKITEKSKIVDKDKNGELWKKETYQKKRESPLGKDLSSDIALKNTEKNKMDINRELEFEKRKRREEELQEVEEEEESGLFGTFKRLLKNTWNFFFGAFARF